MSAKEMEAPPDDMIPQGALAALLARQGYGGESATFAPLDVNALSLLPPGFAPVGLEKAAGEAGRKIVEGAVAKILPREQGREKEEAAGLKRSYCDPALRKPAVYVHLLSRLAAAGLIEHRRKSHKQVGIFAVWKKSGAQRLILDARVSNCAFGDPGKVTLATGQSFAALEVDAGPPIWIGGVDIADAFYAIALLPPLVEYFGLPPITAGRAGVSEVCGQSVSAGEMIVPCFSAVPMGWTLALGICQSLHEHLAYQAPGVEKENVLLDGRPAPRLTPAVHTGYVDNLIALGRSRDPVERLATLVDKALTGAGFPTLEVEVSRGGDTLGWHFDEEIPCVGINLRGAWRFRMGRMGIEALLMKGAATGDELSAVVGHYTFRALIRRELLSALSAVCAFIEKNRKRRALLWPAVIRELVRRKGLIVLARRNLAATLSPRVHVDDASPWGRGVVSRRFPVEKVKEMGRVNERWRSVLETGREGPSPQRHCLRVC